MPSCCDKMINIMSKPMAYERRDLLLDEQCFEAHTCKLSTFSVAESYIDHFMLLTTREVRWWGWEGGGRVWPVLHLESHRQTR